jgi:hypothetical protein
MGGVVETRFGGEAEEHRAEQGEVEVEESGHDIIINVVTVLWENKQNVDMKT